MNEADGGDEDESVAHAREQAGALPEARDAYLAAVERDPKLTEGHERLGLLLASQGRCAEAVPHFERALATSPSRCRLCRRP